MKTRIPTQRDQLLDRRICDLGVSIEGSPLEERLELLGEEFARRGFRFRPYAWLSTDWFAPDDATGFAMPFYLADPALVRLERSQMLEVEGGSHAQCMKLMRHEAAHTLDNAYGLRRKKSWREVFGRAGMPYRSAYSPDPTSREYVLHLDYWYSQSHPLEDFAETFAVWLKPGSRWRARYKGWPALGKLEYVDALMKEIADIPPKKVTRRREEPADRVRMTLRTYYDRKKQVYADEGTPAFDGQLLRMFPSPTVTGEGGSLPGDLQSAPRLAPFLRKHRDRLVRQVSTGTGQHRYLVDHVVREMAARAKVSDLRMTRGPEDALVDMAILLTSFTSQFLYGGHAKYQR